MNPTYAVYTHIARPVDQVFNAVVDRETFEKLIFQSSSGDLVEGTTVTWDNGAWACDVHVDLVVVNGSKSLFVPRILRFQNCAKAIGAITRQRSCFFSSPRI